ncbi:TetR/AcrR family transcriptional regulator [Sinisalibacter aestuarii]|uniref:HTH tetR-type domain-containing protein n=1 Tax=Sinisalibacter aestuarii TaxID=2949426 RepID=A0ABQ5LYD0_9RHOB|nr:TetR/AcrR family transcriptional regulator [Sinisalibacter aestuarii]GKY89955.1 hypothetical protein STA1M1_38240 [Sinisalibacter aestuarii]
MSEIRDTLMAGDAFAALAFHEEADPSRQRSAHVRETIVGVAERKFLDFGYDAVSTHEISKEAGVPQSLIRYHFGAKIGLWQAAMDAYFGRFRNDFHARITALSGLDDASFLRGVIGFIASWPASNYPYIQKAMAEINRDDADMLGWLAARHIQPIYRVVTQILAGGQRAGLVRDVPLPNLYYILFLASSIFGLSDEIGLVTGVDATAESFEKDHAQAVISLLMR